MLVGFSKRILLYEVGIPVMTYAYDINFPDQRSQNQPGKTIGFDLLAEWFSSNS